MDKINKKTKCLCVRRGKYYCLERNTNSFHKTFGSEIYNSWLEKLTLIKEYNDYLILGVPTRFFRDWIVSRYLDKILESKRI